MDRDRSGNLDYAPFGKDAPTGTRFLSPSFEVACRSLSGQSPFSNYKYWLQAVAELRGLKGGEQAYEEVLKSFRDENHREPGDTRALAQQFEEEFENAQTWRWTYDFHAEKYVDDIARIAYGLANKFDGENNPRTPEFIRRISKDYEKLGNTALDSYNDGLFAREIPRETYVGRGPSDTDKERQNERFVEDWGKNWEDMDEEDFNNEPGAAIDALRRFPGQVEARSTAQREWSLLGPILRQVKSWHNFYSDEEEYVTRRTNMLLGSPIKLAPYQHAPEALAKFNPSMALNMDCDAVLGFVRLYDLYNGERKVFDVISDALEFYCGDKEGAVRKSVESTGINYNDDPERFLREWNNRAKYGLRFSRANHERRR